MLPTCKFCGSTEVPSDLACIAMCEPCFDIDLLMRRLDLRHRRGRRVARRWGVPSRPRRAAIRA